MSPIATSMSEQPLLLTDIMRHGEAVHANSTVTTAQGTATPRTRTLRELGQRARRLVNALGVQQGDVVATLSWNCKHD